MAQITVVLPVGPLPHHKQWLSQMLASLWGQTSPPEEVLLIDDMAGLPLGAGATRLDNGVWAVREGPYARCHIWRAPWRLGCAAGWNIGIALAQNELCLMAGADDWLEPACLEFCWEEWQRRSDPLGYYHLTIKYQDTRPDPIQDLPCNAAMVTKRLWQHCGGFAPETAIGAPDAALISVFLAHPEAGHLWPVRKGTPLYNVRVHPGQDTAERGPYQGAILAVRNILTQRWAPPQWGRNTV